MNLIQKELDDISPYKLDLIPHTKLVELCRTNVAKVEAAIRNDSSYLRSSMKEAGPDRRRYGGSTAYWMTQLRDVLIHGKSVSCDGHDLDEILKNAVSSVDRENSTHLNADGGGRDQMFDRLRIDKGLLHEYLQNPQSTGYMLIQILSDPTKPKDGKGSKGGDLKARRNLSFASKFCQEACFYLFEGTEYQDNFSKYDNIVRKAIPLYQAYYRLPVTKKKVLDAKTVESYKAYQEAIDAIRFKLDEPISRNGFDHLIWYYFKGRPELLKSGRGFRDE